MRKLLFQIISAITGLWLATMFTPEVKIEVLSDSNFFGIPLTAQWQLFILFGVILGLLSFFVKPILDAITLPLRIITLGLFSFPINIALIWIADIMFKELHVPLFLPLLYTALIIWGLNILLSILTKKES